MNILNLKKNIINIHEKNTKKFKNKYWYKDENQTSLLNLKLLTHLKFNLNKNFMSLIDTIYTNGINKSKISHESKIVTNSVNIIKDIISILFILENSDLKNTDIHIENIYDICKNKIFNNNNTSYNYEIILNRILNTINYDNSNDFLTHVRHIIIILNNINDLEYKSLNLNDCINIKLTKEL